MKSPLLGLLCLSIAVPVFSRPDAPAASEYRITAELRDGSRLVGQLADEKLKFHSALLGDFKLAPQDIRSVECVFTNAAKLITANGDTLSVTFEAFTLKTSFAKVELEQKSLRKFTISTIGKGGARRPGLVALWSGENNGKDSAGNNDAELSDITFAEGKVGQAFSMNNSTAHVKIPANPNINVGKDSGFTVMAWIKPTDVFKHNPIFDWLKIGQRGFGGAHFYIYPPHGGPGTLYANIPDEDGQSHYFSIPDAITPNVFQHVALTYDKESGMAKIYCNGAMIAQSRLGSFSTLTDMDLYLGCRPPTNGEEFNFTGLMDEAALYNRALSAEEIKSISTEDNGGELPPPPSKKRPYPIRSGFNSGVFTD